MKRNLMTALRMTLVTTILLGLIYPFLITALSKTFFKDKANGQLVTKNGVVVGSRIIAQPFTGAAYFHPRPSAAGNGYDPTNSGATNYGPTNQKLIDRIKSDVATLQAENPGKPIPVDMVTTSGSGLDPHISPAAAGFQIPRVARARSMSQSDVAKLIGEHTEGRQFGFLGEPRVNVLELNLALDEKFPVKTSAK